MHPFVHNAYRHSRSAARNAEEEQIPAAANSEQAEAVRPVVPPAVRSLSARHIIVAWKDTREARRATWDALPFLCAADSVRVLEMTDEADPEPVRGRVGDVVRHLERHQVKAQGEVRNQREASAADEIILAAERDGADLIVAGGYGHARLREWVFGGVTRDLLRHCPTCCLLSH
jgi:nucleotide-binding universal stress UspA family protein